MCLQAYCFSTILNFTYLEYVLNSQVPFKTHGTMETAAGSTATETDPS